MSERDTLRLAKRALEQAQDCILGEAPPDITRKRAREDTLNKIQKAIRALAIPSADRVCAKCGCETKGEEAFVNGEIWCHPCADTCSHTSTQHSGGDQ